MNLNLKNKYALVTGGSHGIGKAIALSLASEGCNVAICARNIENLTKTISALEAIGIRAIAVRADVTLDNDIDNVMQTIQDNFGVLDILINNVGGGGRWGNSIPEETEESVWNEVYAKNAHAAIRFTMKSIQYMIKQNWGRVITISSIYGCEGGGRPWFNMAKSAEISLMKCLSMMSRYATKNITFNSVAPGAIMIQDAGWDKLRIEDHAKYSEILHDIPMQRFGTPEEIAHLVTFLCSDKANFINGTAIKIDGGQSRSF